MDILIPAELAVDLRCECNSKTGAAAITGELVILSTYFTNILMVSDLLSTYCPTKVDKQLGWVVRDPGFRPNLNIQPIKK